MPLRVTFSYQRFPFGLVEIHSFTPFSGSVTNALASCLRNRANSWIYILQHWTWDQNFSQKCQYPPTRLYGSTAQVQNTNSNRRGNLHCWSCSEFCQNWRHLLAQIPNLYEKIVSSRGEFSLDILTNFHVLSLPQHNNVTLIDLRNFIHIWYLRVYVRHRPANVQKKGTFRWAPKPTFAIL
jgi:hypothetical protein